MSGPGKSVVVPVDLAETPAIRNAIGLYRSAILCGEQWSDACRDAYLAALKELDQLAMLAAAPAPSSLAGGEVRELIDAASEVRDLLKATPAMNGREYIGVGLRFVNAIEAARRALLSPEAPARVGGEWFGVTGAADEAEALAVALFDARCPGIRMTDEDLHYYRAAAQRAMKAVVDELDTPALTRRHEAPADHHEQNLTASNAELIEQALSHPPLEAPAEGAGERDRIIAFLKERDEACGTIEADDDERGVSADLILGLMEGPVEAPAPTCQKCGGEIAGWCCQQCPAEFRENDDGVLIFNEEAPAEGALEEAIKHLTEMSELETVYGQLSRNLRVVLSALRARSSAPEAREEAAAWVFELATCCDAETGAYSSWNPPQLSFIKPCVPAGSIRNLAALGPIGHPAAPSADKLRIAVEALEEIADTDPDDGASWFHERADQALAALHTDVAK